MHQPTFLRLGFNDGRRSPRRRPSKAFLLFDGGTQSGERNLSHLLDFFGIPWKAVSLGEMAAESSDAESDRTGFCVLTPAPLIAAALQGGAESDATLSPWLLNASSVYVYGFEDTAPCKRLLQYLRLSLVCDVRKPSVRETRLSVTRGFPEMCGPLSGISALARMSGTDRYFQFHGPGEEYQKIITAEDGAIFASVVRNGVRFFLSGCPEVIDINSPATRYFDVKNHFCSAVPIMMYLKWAFADICWTGAETTGSLIVDDPLLKPRYGFLRYREILESMDLHNFTTTIAFIPRNWRRTNRQTVGLFQSRHDKLSLCVHGCDHTGAEFADRSTRTLNRKIKTAKRRMDMLSRTTSLQYDPIMVFPQGSFSPEAGHVLKLNGFVAAVNTEVAPLDNSENCTAIADLWDVAIMKYGSFPIFTRRYLTHSIENFAFDALLGKPCLIVAHHEVFKDGGRELTEFIERLNSLNWTLRWCSLGDAVSHSFKVRKHTSGARAIRMYAERLVIRNSSFEPQEVVAIKEESDPNSVRAVMVNQKTIGHAWEGSYLQFNLTMQPGERVEIRVIYFDKPDIDSHEEGIAYQTKVLLRRRLSEIRDNYFSQSNLLSAAAARVKRFLS